MTSEALQDLSKKMTAFTKSIIISKHEGYLLNYKPKNLVIGQVSVFGCYEHLHQVYKFNRIKQ